MSNLKENKIYIDTGNLLHCSFKKENSYRPHEEAFKGFKWRVCLWNNQRKDDKQKQANISSNDHLIAITGNEPEMRKWVKENKRESLRIIVKLFLYDEEQHAIEDAISSVCKQLETNYLDTLILSLPSRGKELSRDRIRRIWSHAEQATHYNVKDLGMSDLNADQLIDLHSFATIKPTNNQINLELCCSIPEKMSEFAHEHGIKLLTHGDPVDFLPQNRFKELLQDCETKDINNWRRLYVARYIVIQEHRGIVLCKGYLLSAHRK